MVIGRRMGVHNITWYDDDDDDIDIDDGSDGDDDNDGGGFFGILQP